MMSPGSPKATGTTAPGPDVLASIPGRDTDTVREIGKAALSIGLTQRDVGRITASAQEIAAHPKAQAQREAG